MKPNVEALPISQQKVGEGPHWNPRTESLYLLDILGKTLTRYHAATEEVYTLNLDVPSIGFVTPVAGSDDKFLIGAGLNLRVIQWDGVSDKVQSDEIIHTLSTEPKGNRINDGKADPTGRIWFGTMKTEDILNGREGAFYNFTKDGGCKKILSEIGISNGMSFNEKKNEMYYIDSLTSCVEALDYSSSGTTGKRRIVFDLKKNNVKGFPDGMSIDSDGNLWVACFSGSRVIKVNPDTGKLLQEVEIPSLNVTSSAWGGPYFSELFVTTAMDEADPNSGKVFRVRGLGCTGRPMSEFKL